MNAKRCDRCGIFYEDNNRDNPIITPEYRSGVTLDLCSECVKEFYQWLHTHYYYEKQSEKGYDFPAEVQNCCNCIYYKREVPRECTLGKKWRDVDEICIRWRYRKDGNQTNERTAEH